VEELVHRPRGGVAHPQHRAEGVGARPQVGDGAQELERVSLLLQWELLRVGRADQFQAAGLKFDPLFRAGRGFEFAHDAHACAGVDLPDRLRVTGHAGVNDNLQVRQARAVVEFDERKRLFRVPPGADPAGDVDRRAGLTGCEQLGDAHL
jgi:hypothetical protein